MSNKTAYKNVSQKEIIKFETLSSHWWDPKSKMKLLHRLNPLRLHYIMQRSGGLFNKKVLDVGCGGGILAESMAREGAIVTGLDAGLELLHIASLHALKSGIKINYVQGTVEEHLTKHNCQYDIITCMEMLEHVPDPESTVMACAQLVKSNGGVFFSTINRNKKAWLMTIVVAEYVLHMMPVGTHDIKKFIKPAELLSWIDKSCLKEKHMTGLHYNLLTDEFRLGPGVDINYILHTTTK